MTKVYIGLGSNLDNPDHQIEQALQHVRAMSNTELVLVSSLYSSKPMGPQNQPNYMNAVACITTTLSAMELLDQLQTIETLFGRIRKDQRWGARVLDLDILLFGEYEINNERLTIPHYGMKTREFVIYPLAEISDNLVLPDGTSVEKLRNQLPLNGLIVVRKLH